MSEKRILIWVIAHVVVASIVMGEMRRRRKPEREIKIAGHLAGSVAGLFLSSVL